MIKFSSAIHIFLILLFTTSAFGQIENAILDLSQYKIYPKVNNVIPEGEYVRVQGQLPAAELIGIADEIRGATQGRAFFGYEFKGFEKVPPNLEEDLILEIRRRKGMPEELPSGKSWERFIYKKT